MNQLELRVYNREEIAAIVGADVKNNQFARKVKSTLDNWGYKYEYSSKAVTITEVPTTLAAKLKELLIRYLGMDIRVEPYAFGNFFTRVCNDESFGHMPWSERVKVLKEKDKITVNEKTLRNWASHLYSIGFIKKDYDNYKEWITTGVGFNKKRRPVEEGDKALVEAYKQKRKELTTAYMSEGNDYYVACGLAFKELYNSEEFYQMAVYRCYAFQSANFFNDVAQELVEEIEDLCRQLSLTNKTIEDIKVQRKQMEEMKTIVLKKPATEEAAAVIKFKPNKNNRRMTTLYSLDDTYEKTYN